MTAEAADDRTDDLDAGVEPAAVPADDDDEIIDAELVEAEERGMIQGIILASQSSHSGPLPQVSEFRGYGEVLPSAPERILAMAERALDHRITQEDRANQTDRTTALLGLVFAFILAVVVLGGSVWIILEGQAVAGTILATLDLVALVTVFILGRSKSGE